MDEFDHNEFPLAYLITARCYGTWLHGNEQLIMCSLGRAIFPISTTSVHSP
jgi:hypothetical protein